MCSGKGVSGEELLLVWRILMVRALGIDPSTKTGLVLLGEDDQPLVKVVTAPGEQGMARVQKIARSVSQFLSDGRPDVAVIEGYAFANKFTLVTLVEIGAILRLCLHESGIPWYYCPPSVLKKYATGKGNAKKPQVASSVESRWGFVAPSDDVVDAYVLAKIGLDLSVNGVTTALKGVQNGQ
jgi:crossover junction endodeoxyribonuclease RuvC